jgi:drug/metabolite transporter (DMT)-like permease
MQARLRQLIPVTFVLIWSSGFIIARYGMPHAEPMTFLFMRFVGVLAIMVPVVLLIRPVWPSRSQTLHIGLAGVLLHAGYLGGVWAAVKLGMSAGLVALIVGLQPILTACVSAALSERITARQWAGLAVGLAGVTLVVIAKLSLANISWANVSLATLGLLSITAGTVYQKRFCPTFDLRAGSVIQFSVSALACLPFMFLIETRQIDWHPELIGALIWAIFGLSILAISLLFLMIREGAATQISSLLYLTPPTTAAMAWMLFDEPVTIGTIAGTLLTVWGVWWVTSTGSGGGSGGGGSGAERRAGVG